MGREVRMVPKGWEHPRNQGIQALGLSIPAYSRSGDDYHPMFSERYVEAAREWLDECLKWDNGTHEAIAEDPSRKDESPFYWDWAGSPPDKAYYRFDKWDFKPEEATCFQIYETVSEGTPVSPVFESEEQMIEWLIGQGHTRTSAEAFAVSAWVPSMVMTGGKVYTGIDIGDIPKESAQ